MSKTHRLCTFLFLLALKQRASCAFYAGKSHQERLNYKKSPASTTSRSASQKSAWQRKYYHNDNRINGLSMIMNTISVERGGNLDENKGSNPSNLFQQYSRFVDQQPLLAKSMTAGIVTTMANLFSQIVVPRLQSSASSIIAPISWRRVFVFMMTGCCFIGPYLHVWYGFLDRLFAMPHQSNTTRTISKVLIDQTIGLFIFFPLYFMSLEISESLFLFRAPLIVRSLETCRSEIFGIAVMNWRIWPITNAINFGVIPLQLRVLVNQIVSFFWFAYLSTRATR